MAYSGLQSFILKLEEKDELTRVKVPVSTDLEITEITDRVVKTGGKALLFENTGKQFPLLINIFGSDTRIGLALGRENPYDAGADIEKLMAAFSGNSGTLFGKIASIPDLLKLSSILPKKIRGRGPCQEVIHDDPDLGILPVIKCWPYDGGPFITLPIVHTCHPETGSANAGMYRMQILGRSETAMHWQRHKTGANHFEAWKKAGKRMPVSVVLGGDPVYTYAATAPLPENVNEYILAGFLRNKKVKLVKCITNEIYVPADADIILEGFVDPAEDLVWEGPFGDHTGFYSLADWYPRFHVTCITHRKNAVYPATIVGIPPQEDAFLAKATERIFLSPVKMAMLPEIVDFHMPDAGTAHNLVIVKIKKSYPGQGMKVIGSLLGAGQMMFSKYIVVVSGEVDIRNYADLARHVSENLDPRTDIVFTRGPLDVLDHASDRYSFGGKAGFDASVKLNEELDGQGIKRIHGESFLLKDIQNTAIHSVDTKLTDQGIPVIIISADPRKCPDVNQAVKDLISSNAGSRIGLILIVNHPAEADDYFTVAWQVLANSDPMRDHEFISSGCLLIDGTIKSFRKGGFPRKWPNVVCSNEQTIAMVDKKWESYGIGAKVASPSLKYRKLLQEGKDAVTT